MLPAKMMDSMQTLSGNTRCGRRERAPIDAMAMSIELLLRFDRLAREMVSHAFAAARDEDAFRSICVEAFPEHAAMWRVFDEGFL